MLRTSFMPFALLIVYHISVGEAIVEIGHEGGGGGGGPRGRRGKPQTATGGALPGHEADCLSRGAEKGMGMFL